MNTEPKMVLVVRTDLGMGKGKIAAQVAHAAVAAVLQGPHGAVFGDWLRAGQPKVVLKIAGRPTSPTCAPGPAPRACRCR